jgi:uncharacterized SAM-binding protein YcdF (DUF218 family)
VLAALGVWFVNAGNLLISAQPPIHADAIIVLAGNSPDRLAWAETLRNEGYADLLVVSDEPVHTHGMETTWRALHEAGVSAPDIPDTSLIVLDSPPPESTIDEARRDAALLQARGLHSALLVTDAFHSRRAALLFGAAFVHRGLSVRSVPAPDSFDLAHWWLHPVTARRVTEEYAKLVYYLPQGAYW